MIRRPLVWLWLTGALYGQAPRVHTYSIMARDPATGELGVAVATQSMVEISYGPPGLDLMRAWPRSRPPSARAAIFAGGSPRPC